MAQHSLITLSSTTATRLSPNGIHSGVDITIQNINNNGYIYIGGNDTVSSTSYGFRLIPNQAISFELPGADALYAVSEYNNMNVAIMKTGLEFMNG